MSASRASAFHKDLDRLAREVGKVRTESRLAGEEAMGAELLATRDLVAHLGIAWETAEQLGDIASRQAQHFAEDHLKTLSQWLDGTAVRDPGTALGRHLERRLTHLTEGLQQSIEVASVQSEKTWQAMLTLWSPFFSVLRQDWAGQRARSRSEGSG